MALGKKFGGRVKGTPNKSTEKVARLARRHGPAAIKELHSLMTTAPEKAVRVSAARELLDRGYGKATQPVGGDAANPIHIKLDRDDSNL
jgi:hypothetical protein